MAQTWHDLLFAHWPVPAVALRPLLPPQLDLDTFDGEAWLGVVPFRMSRVHPRGLPALPFLSAFPELNVRTYARAAGKAGVWFFSLDAASRVAVELARWSFHLPYLHARMRCAADGPAVAYDSRRLDRRAPAADFSARYAPAGPVSPAVSDTLADWLTARYCLFAADHSGRLYRGDIHHAPWPLQPAEAEIEVNTMAAAAGIRLPDAPPLLHFARSLEVLVWPLVRLDGDRPSPAVA
jgi:uncharacterized protein YqjF (DUF2071 family)